MEDRNLFLPQPIPVARSILWKPLPDSFHLLARVLEGAETYKMFISQDTLLDIEDTIRTSQRHHVLGLLLGNLYQCPDTGVRFVIVGSHLLSAHRLDEETEAISPEVWESLQADLRSRSGRLLGWYRSHSRIGRRLEQPDALVHERYFPQPWQSALLLTVDEWRTTGGLFLVEKRTGRSYYSPFYELLDSASVHHTGTKRTCVSWYNYVTEDAVLPFAGWERHAATAALPAPPVNGGSPFLGRLIGDLKRKLSALGARGTPEASRASATSRNRSSDDASFLMERLKDTSFQTESEVPRVPVRDVEAERPSRHPVEREREPIAGASSPLLISSSGPRRLFPARLKVQAPVASATSGTSAVRDMPAPPATPSMQAPPSVEIPPERLEPRAVRHFAEVESEHLPPVVRGGGDAMRADQNGGGGPIAGEDDDDELQPPRPESATPAGAAPAILGGVLLPANFFQEAERSKRQRRIFTIGGGATLLAALGILLAAIGGDDTSTRFRRSAEAMGRMQAPSVRRGVDQPSAVGASPSAPAAATPSAGSIDTLFTRFEIQRDSVERSLAAYQVLDGDFAEKQIDCAALTKGYRELRRHYFALAELRSEVQSQLDEQRAARYGFLTTKLMEVDALYSASQCGRR